MNHTCRDDNCIPGLNLSDDAVLMTIFCSTGRATEAILHIRIFLSHRLDIILRRIRQVYGTGPSNIRYNLPHIDKYILQNDNF